MTEYDPQYVEIKHYFRIGVKLILTNTQDEILLLKRSDKSSRSHSWDFPGGAVDSHESPETATMRELHEETGVSVSEVHLYTSQYVTEGDDDAVILGFYGSTKDTKVKLSWEHESYEWMTQDEIMKLDLQDLHASLLHSYIFRR